jgi:mono/diheme cytochrome c family protein
MNRVLWTLTALAVLALGGWLFVTCGLYDVSADRPHTAWMHAILDTVRSRSVEAHARNIKVPPLETWRLAEGAEHYTAMCTGCHLAPGLPETEIRQGLLPKPPDLSRTRIDPAEAFWVIKHGIKATAMPAWGKTHDDEEIWNLVAFIQRLPTMTPEQYRAMAGTHEDGNASMPDGHHEPGHEEREPPHTHPG